MALGGVSTRRYFFDDFLAALALGAAFLAAAFFAGLAVDFGAAFAALALSAPAASPGDEPNAIEKLSPYFLDGALRTIGPLIP